jgi:uncharacterized protein (DUF433 family)
MIGGMATILDREMYTVAGAASLLGLRSDRVRAWLDGYEGRGVWYEPVVRSQRSGSDIVTWGEFVELGLLREYRKSGVSLQRIRPVIERLRAEYGAPYPLAHHRPYVGDRELVLAIQESEHLDSRLALVVRTGQTLALAPAAENFLRKVEFDGDIASLVRPAGPYSPVRIDPSRAFGHPSVRAVATERLHELHQAGDSIALLAEAYSLSEEDIRSALAYEEIHQAVAA